MNFENNRNGIITALFSMGIEIPANTKLTTEELVKRLARAIDYSQLLHETKVKPDIDPSKFKKWEIPEDQTLEDCVWRGSADEAAQLADFEAGGSIPLSSIAGDLSVHMQLRVSIAQICRFYEAGHRIVVCLNSDESHSVLLRMIDVVAYTEEDLMFAVIYDHSPGGVDPDYIPFFLSHGLGLLGTIPMLRMSVLEQMLLLKILELNSKRVSPNFKPTRNPIERNFKTSFILPLNPLNQEARGSLTRNLGCKRCGSPSKAKCSRCQTVEYCGRECQLADWKEHKTICKPLEKGTWTNVRFSIAPYVTSINRFTTTSDLRNLGKFSKSGSEPPEDTHGGEPFLVKIQHSQSPMPILIYDRKREFQVQIMTGVDPQGYATIAQAVRVGPGYMGLKIYRWVKRVDDWKISVCLDRVPAEDSIQW